MAGIIGGLAKAGFAGLGRVNNAMNMTGLNDYPNVKYGLGKWGNSAAAGAGTMAGGLAIKGMYNVLTGNGPLQRRKKARQAQAMAPPSSSRPSSGGCGCGCSAPRKPTCVKKRKPTCKRPKPKPKRTYCSTSGSRYSSAAVPYSSSKPRVAGRQARRTARVDGRQARRTNRQSARQQRRFYRRN